MAGIFTNGLDESHKTLFITPLSYSSPQESSDAFVIFNSFNTFFPVVLCLGDGDVQQNWSERPHKAGRSSRNSKEIMGSIVPHLYITLTVHVSKTVSKQSHFIQKVTENRSKHNLI